MVDHTSLMPKLSATEAPHVASICARTAPKPGARLARGDDVAQAERRRVEPGLARAAGEVRRERQRAVDRREPQAGDEVEQPLRLAHAHGHDGRARGLERHVVGDAAGVERVVQAVGDDVARRARPAMANAAPPMAELASWSARVSPMATGSPVVPEVTCRRTSASGGAHRCSPKGGRAACEARRSPWSAAGRPRATRAGQPLAVEGRAALQVGELGSQRRGIGHAAHASRPATRRAARWAARCRDA